MPASTTKQSASGGEAMQDNYFASRYKTATMISDLHAEALVAASGITSSELKPLVVFDNACGTGAVTSTLYNTLDKETLNNWKLTCGDMSQSMLGYLQKRIVEEDWVNAEARIIDSQDTGLESSAFTHIFSGFAFNLFPDPQAALKGGWFTITRTAIHKYLSPSLPYPGEEILNLIDSGWPTESGVRSYLETAGFADIQTSVDVKKCRMTPDDLVDACTMIVPAIIKKFWTPEQREAYEGKVVGAVREYVNSVLGEDGKGVLEAEAVIAVARKG
ncbi:class I SAM-dependent methyltransferase [Aspergillus stella-maris]|uniref:class I SAM-dependent methyltransferase n=1 Tax=Aspergillus stella-maris TaxID=1810926 RepID=UPI003CCE29EB